MGLYAGARRLWGNVGWKEGMCVTDVHLRLAVAKRLRGLLLFVFPAHAELLCVCLCLKY